MTTSGVLPSYITFSVKGSGPTIRAAAFNAVQLASEAVPEGWSLTEHRLLDPQVESSITTYLDGVPQRNTILGWEITLLATCERTK